MTRVIDAHQHLWDLGRSEYGWLTPELEPIYRSFAPDELEPQLARSGIDGTVLVQAENSYVDTDYMLSIADERPWVSGVVGWVPLLEPDEAARALDRYQRHPAFKGLRHLIHDEPDPDWLLQDRVTEGLRLLAERGMTYDVVSVLPRHLEHVPTLVDRVPELRMVIDHLSKPPIADQGWEPWASLLRAAAESPNVYAKVSGLNTAASWETWTAGDLKPYVSYALEVFGPERLMFGSDWPVALLAGNYQKVWDETQVVLNDLDDTERALVLGGTATRFYQLKEA